MSSRPEFNERLQSIERLIGEIEAVADPNLRKTVHGLMELVMGLHGEGLERILDIVQESGDGTNIIAKMGRDELVASLLILYGLHPVDIRSRLNQALEKARQRLRPHQGDVELLSLQDGAVRLRLKANGHGCGSTAQELKELVDLLERVRGPLTA